MRAQRNLNHPHQAGLAALLLLLTSVSHAAGSGDRLKSRFGSDAASRETFWSLLSKTVELEASVGLWSAHLSGGLSALVAKLDDTPVNKAIDSISTGDGLVREVRFGLRVGDNRAYFSYLSDRLFDSAESAVKERVDSRVIQETILQIMGELRPDLGDYLPDDATAFMKVQYGKIIGSIEDPWRFSTRYGKPWFGGKNERWETEYFSIEVGALYETKGMSEFQTSIAKRRRGWGGKSGGLFGRFRRFSKPLVLGFGNDAGTSDGGFTLEDATLDTYTMGLRWDILSCETICWRATGDFVPFTGIAHLDLGRFGTQWGLPLGGGFEVKGSLPLNLFGGLFLSPYVGFQADFLFPIFLDNAFSADIDTITMWLPDYLLWGPSAGITGRF